MLLGVIVCSSFYTRAYCLPRPGSDTTLGCAQAQVAIVGDIILKATLPFAYSFALSSQSTVPLVQALTVLAGKWITLWQPR
jgi:MSHA biogenesis protein MshG